MLMSTSRRGGRVGLVDERADRHDPGVVDEHVERAQLTLDLVEEGGEALTIGHVERQPDRSAAELGCGLLDQRGVDVADATRAPCAISAAAVARPIPRAPPVIATTCPFSDRKVFAICRSSSWCCAMHGTVRRPG